MSEESIVNLLIAVIAATGAIFTKHFMDRWKEARGRKLDEAQRIAKREDKLRHELDQERACKREWEAAFHSVRVKAIQNGVPHDQVEPPNKPA